jgi:carboxylesterase
MGGALAAQLAAEQPALPCLVLLAPYLAMPRRVAIAARLSRLWNPVVPFVRALDPTAPRSIHDDAEASRSLAYGVFTPAALRALHQTVTAAVSALPRIASPTLMIQSGEDNRVAPQAAQRAFDRIGSKEKQLIWITGAGHVITVDFGRDRVFELVVGWLDRHRAARPRERRA